MAELSTAAQAVLDATDYPEDWATRIRVACALRAAADHVVPQEPPFSGGMRPSGTGALTLDEAQMFQRSSTRRRLLAIATELESAQ